MKRSKFSEAQIAFILRQAEEGTSVAKLHDAAAYVDREDNHTAGSAISTR